MSQVSKQVKWCMDKANKEIAECKKQEKREKHRGILEKEPDIEDARQHLEKAKYNLKAVNHLLKGNFIDLSISTIFYVNYHCFLAIASKFGYESCNQTCTISLIEWLKEEGKIAIDNKFTAMFKYEEDGKKEDSLIEMREESTYGIEINEGQKEKVQQLLQDCKELIDETNEIIYA